jgi:hypothetical protein
MRRYRLLLPEIVFIGSLTLWGCAEKLYVRSMPEGATLTVNGTHVGVTPVLAKVPRSEMTAPIL